MAKTEADTLFEAVQKYYGEDVIIVHKKDLPYYITTSALKPPVTGTILKTLAAKFR